MAQAPFSGSKSMEVSKTRSLGVTPDISRRRFTSIDRTHGQSGSLTRSVVSRSYGSDCPEVVCQVLVFKIFVRHGEVAAITPVAPPGVAAEKTSVVGIVPP